MAIVGILGMRQQYSTSERQHHEAIHYRILDHTIVYVQYKTPIQKSSLFQLNALVGCLLSIVCCLLSVVCCLLNVVFFCTFVRKTKATTSQSASQSVCWFFIWTLGRKTTTHARRQQRTLNDSSLDYIHCEYLNHCLLIITWSTKIVVEVILATCFDR